MMKNTAFKHFLQEGNAPKAKNLKIADFGPKTQYKIL
jgi:hypothetical protein